MVRLLALLSLPVTVGALTACKAATEVPTPTDDTDVPTAPPTGSVDADNDGYTASIDCDDGNPDINPGATETCNGVDDDCSGIVDDDPIDGVTAYADADQDGYGDSLTGVGLCGTVPAGFASQGGDCDDDDSDRYPGATEACDGVDADCDGQPGYLDPDTPGGADFYADADGDGYGTGPSVQACAAPIGYVGQSGDCNDGNSNAYPGAPEICDNADNNCDGTVDEGLELTWYRDADNDGYGTAQTTVGACSQPVGYVAVAGDCDDTRLVVFPGAIELCDTYDNDCDGHVDDDDLDTPPANAGTWYADADLDGYGVGEGTTSCEQPPHTVALGGDCDDDDPDLNPGAAELCDTYDNDCDGYADDEDPEGPDDPDHTNRFYTDYDEDGYGDPLVYVDACLPPLDAVANGDDCDDTDPYVNPNALEVCNGGIDDNCDGVIDDADPEVIIATWYVDADEDGYGDPLAPTLEQCEPPVGYALDNTDCDDTRDDVYPGALEICDTYDNDCDTYVDDADDEVHAPLYYVDADLDGYGAEPGAPYCEPPLDRIDVGGDCDDARHDVYPGAAEICDTYDNDCDTYVDDDDPDVLGDISAYVDADLDGYGYGPSVLICALGPGFADNDLDCDDAYDEDYPGADEVCDGRDNDCDTLIDDDDPEVQADIDAYYDGDGDGYGDGPVILVCDVVDPYVELDGDCDDTNVYANPGAFDWADGTDLDCDGTPDDDVGTEAYSAADVQAIWNSSCGPCHLGASSAGGLSLNNGYASTVGVPSNDVPAMYQITPGDPAQSYIWAALTNTRAQAGGAGGIMPPGGPLSPSDLDIVETWILEGAIP